MSKVMINIHGAGKEMSNFYQEGLDALTALLGAKPNMIPVWYADLCNIGSPVFGTAEELSPEEQEFVASFRQQIRERRQQIEAQSPPGSEEFGLLDTGYIIADVVADVTRYLFDENLRQSIMQRLIDGLEQAVGKYDEIILISHSLGTVVAFDVLHDCADRYKVGKFFTMGSPLRKLVELRRRSSGLGAINSSTVPFWRNLYDTTDAVANAIGPAFPDYPIQDVFIQVADLPIPSHDYWRNKQVLKMLADTLRS